VPAKLEADATIISTFVSSKYRAVTAAYNEAEFTTNIVSNLKANDTAFDAA